MEETSKTYMFGQDNSLLAALIPMFAQRGIDASTLAALMNNGNGFGGNNFLWIIFLFFLMGWGGNGFGGFNNGGNGTAFLANQLNNDAGRDLLLQAIQGNGAAISQLATNLNSDVNAVRGAVGSLMTAVQNVGSQVGMTGLQTQNAIQSGDAALSRQLCECCCQTQQQIISQGYENRIQTIDQTNTLNGTIVNSGQKTVDAIADLKTTMVKEFCDVKERELQSKIDTQAEIITQLRNQADNAAQTLQFNTGFNALNTKISELAARQPNTVPVTWPNLTAVNNTPNTGNFGWGYGFNPYGYSWNGSSYWG